MAAEIQERRTSTTQVVMFLIYHNERVLVEERIRPDSLYKGFFITPAGHVEAGELPDQAVLREPAEEHGIMPTRFIRLDKFENPNLRGELVSVHAYLITEYVGEVENKEPNKCILHWMTFEEAEDNMVLATDRIVLFKAKQQLSGENGNRI
jgi:8-oxo-dGTP pyrophosphatase MutT (NUDIX family)